MELRLAKKQDLPKLEEMFIKIVEQMNNNGIYIWNEYYPYEEFENDIENNRLFLLTKDNDICASFVVLDELTGEECFNWENKNEKALYMARLGVNVNFLRQGIGTKVLEIGKNIAKQKGLNYIRFTVVKENTPAITLYSKNNFKQVDGIYREYSESLNKTIEELGFELKLN